MILLLQNVQHGSGSQGVCVWSSSEKMLEGSLWDESQEVVFFFPPFVSFSLSGDFISSSTSNY